MRNMIVQDVLVQHFGDNVQFNVPIAKNTSARIGGTADAVTTASSSEGLARVVSTCYLHDIPFRVLGSGSNILISDAGIRELVILNKAKAVIMPSSDELSVYAESGAGLSRLAQQVCAAGYDGLTWAATIPGTVGGAVYGNAGAFGGDVATSLENVDVITINGLQQLSATDMKYKYRSSALKRGEFECVILGARFALKIGDINLLKVKIEELTTKRKSTQPPGASMGSMFKNPPNDFAGRLIEECGLKGTRVGGASISQMHANFFVNEGETTASDVLTLINLARKMVSEKFNINLQLEIELVGEWSLNDR